jgi:methylthioribose-1-phosphate isomerase
LEIIDQRKLPREFVKLKITDTEQLHEAIKTLAVRGAPAIGVAAGYGVVLALQKLKADTSAEQVLNCIEQTSKYLASSRPTAVNLFWALQRVEKQVKSSVASRDSTTVESIKQSVFDIAQAIYKEDVDMCLQIGQNGQKFIPDGGTVLTHCNAGALATAGQGTALSVIFEAHKNGKRFKVYVDETRPLLQGARLTMWELQQAGIDSTLICDSTAGWLMKQNKIDAVIVGADRIAANGDTANKIGTYSLAILAKKHNVPFYVAAPSSTFDMNIISGNEIPIEERPADEVRGFSAAMVAPKDAAVYNPAFDVTEAALITAIITDGSVIEAPDSKSISDFMKEKAHGRT